MTSRVVRGCIGVATALTLGAAWLGAVGCGGSEVPAPGATAARDVVLITIDTWRWDAAGFTGSGKVETPWIDRLAAGGWVAEDARAHAVVTLPSHASILSGRLPYEHGIRDNAGFLYPSELPTLATRLKDAGYRTAAFVSSFPLDRRFGLDVGFDVYDDAYEGYDTRQFTFLERPGDETVARARAWWEANAGDAPRFLWVHLFTPHFPYEPDPDRRDRYADQPYYGDVARADRELGPLLSPWLDGPAESAPIVVLTSDHGEGLGEHGEETHGLFAYDATLKVPLVVWAPGRVEPGRDARPVVHVDLLPTVLDLVGLPTEDGLPGTALFASNGAAAPGPGYFEAMSTYLNRNWAPLTGWHRDGLKAIDLPVPELYDLDDDPGEARNLAEDRPDAFRDLLRRVPEGARRIGDRESLDDELIRNLRSLGYAAGTTHLDDPDSFGPDRDPKNLVDVERRLFRALTEFRAGHPETAVSTLEALLVEQPRLALAYGYLNFMYGEIGRPDRAVEALRRARAAGVDTEPIRRKLALTLVRMGRAAEAWTVLAPDGESPDPETQSALGKVAAAVGRTSEARTRFERALALDPTFPEALANQGILLMQEGRFDEARAFLDRALEADPRNGEAWNARGVLRSMDGDPEGAVDAWRRAVDADPGLLDARFNRGVTLARLGRVDEAIDALEAYARRAPEGDRERALAMVADLRAGRGPRAR